MDLTAFASFVDRVGFPIAFIFVIGLITYRVGKPLLTRITDRHISFIDKLDATLEVISNALTRQTEVLTDIHNRLDRLERNQEELKAAINKGAL